VPAGYLALLLHAHLPFVRHPEHEEFFEEDWLFEAVAETYIPLLRLLRGLVADGVPACLSLTLTPTLCAMLRDPLLQSRAARYLDRGVELTAEEMARTATDAGVNALARYYHQCFVEARDFYEKEIGRDIVAAFAELQADGILEILTCAATHGFLPLMESCPQALRAQVLIGRDSHRECFGTDPLGIWLPECGYVPGVDRALQEADLRWFVIDAHGLMFGEPRPRFAIYAPCYTPGGSAAFARDRESSKQVWSAREGYPGDPAYRDFYRDIGTDLPEEYLHRVLPDIGHRRPTGIKYHRITGHEPKEIYRLDWAMGAADAHAADFMRSRVDQVRHAAEMLPVPPIVMSPFDAELFGHWWFEGPRFLDLFIRKSAYDQDTFAFTTPARFLAQYPTQQVVAPAPSSWGNKGYYEVWLDRCNAWIYPHLHAAARQMTAAAQRFRTTRSKFTSRLLAQMARELLLAQSSDWAFLMKTGTATDYATRRTKDHILRFNRLHEILAKPRRGRPNPADDAFLTACENRDNIFPNINWHYYA
jgi:1,4-alpha-glucan branching enzyme